MDIRAAEISAILKDQIRNFGQEAEVSEVGQVLSVGDGIARVYGLDNVQAGEMVAFETGIRGLSSNFMRLVASNRRLFALPDMMRAFRELVAQSKGIVRAQVTLAEQPSDRVMEDIKSALREVAKAEVDVNVKIDPALIGGLVVKIGSRMVDASLRTKLNSIRLAMKEVR